MTDEEKSIALERRVASIAVARTLTREAAAGLDADLVEDAVLLTSELVTNAIRYGVGRIELRTLADSDALTISVYDDGDTFAVDAVTRPGPESASGRGLGMVHRVAQRWGVDACNGGGKIVWCRLETTHDKPRMQ